MTLFTGISALRANQTAMGVVGHNIANVSTEGYRRQEVLFAENPPIDRDGLRIGTGVHISDIRSVADAALEDSLASSTARGLTEIQARRCTLRSSAARAASAASKTSGATCVTSRKAIASRSTCR